MHTLGLAAFTRRSTAALVADGTSLAEHAEEDFSRQLDDASFPMRAVRACLRQAGRTAGELDAVVFFEKPLRRFERVLTCELAAFPSSIASFPRVVGHWLGEGLWIKARIVSELGIAPERVLFTSHHQAHAAGAFFTSPFDDAVVLVVDGAGEWTTTSVWQGRGSSLEALEELHFPHSLVEAAERIARLLGLHGPQLDALAAHGRPARAGEFAALLGASAAGDLALDLGLRSSGSGAEDSLEQLERIFGRARAPGEALRFEGTESEHADLAAGACRALGDALVALARRALRAGSSKRLCLCGELAAWPGLVDRVMRESGALEVFVPAAPDDAGAALGAALFVQHALHGLPRVQPAAAAWLGSAAEVENSPDREASAATTLTACIDLLVAGRTLARVHGRSAGAGRALGPRCALASPLHADARRALMDDLRREPGYCAPVLLVSERQCDELLDLPAAGRRSAVNHAVRVPLREPWRARLAQAALPDGSVNAQIVERAGAPDLCDLLAGMGARNGVESLLAVDLAQRGEPTVRTAREARELFARSKLDALDLAGRLYLR